MSKDDFKEEFSEMKKLIIDLAHSSALMSRDIIMQNKCVNSLNLLYFDHLKIFHDDNGTPCSFLTGVLPNRDRLSLTLVARASG